MGQIKNIKLHIVTDIKVQTQMYGWTLWEAKGQQGRCGWASPPQTATVSKEDRKMSSRWMEFLLEESTLLSSVMITVEEVPPGTLTLYQFKSAHVQQHWTCGDGCTESDSPSTPTPPWRLETVTSQTSTSTTTMVVVVRRGVRGVCA